MKSQRFFSILLLFVAVILFTGSGLNAQNKDGDHSMKIKIIKKEGGKTIHIDTVVTGKISDLDKFKEEMIIDLDIKELEMKSLEEELGLLHKELDHEMMILSDSCHVKLMKISDVEIDAMDDSVKEMMFIIDAKMEGLDEEMLNHDEHARKIMIEMEVMDDEMKELDEEMLVKMKEMESMMIELELDDDGEVHKKMIWISDDCKTMKQGADNEKVYVFRKDEGGESIIIKTKVLISDPAEGELPEMKSNSKASTEWEKNLNLKALEFYPNPSDGRFHLSFSTGEEGKVNIRVLDSMGKEIYTETIKDFDGTYDKDIDISGQGQGMYFLNISQGSNSITKKIVISN